MHDSAAKNDGGAGREWNRAAAVIPQKIPSFPRKRESIFTDKSPRSRRFFVEKRGEFAVLFLKMDSRFRGNDGGGGVLVFGGNDGVFCGRKCRVLQQ